MEEPGGLQSMGSLGVGHDWVTSLSLFHFHTLEKEMTTHSSVLAWRIPGAGEPGGLTSMGSHRVGHDWSDLAAAAVISDTENLFCLLAICMFSLENVYSDSLPRTSWWLSEKKKDVGRERNRWGKLRDTNFELQNKWVTSMKCTVQGI